MLGLRYRPALLPGRSKQTVSHSFGKQCIQRRPTVRPDMAQHTWRLFSCTHENRRQQMFARLQAQQQPELGASSSTPAGRSLPQDTPIAPTAAEPDTAAAAADAPAASPATPADAPPAAAATAAASPSALDAVAVMQGAEPIDRLRYQAMLIFDHFDADRDGVLSPAELSNFFSFSSKKVLWSPGLSEVLQQVQQGHYSTNPPGSSCTLAAFIRLVRAQVHSVSCSQAYKTTAMRPDESARLQTQMGLNLQELCAAKWVFGLLDYDNDGKVQLSMLSKAEGIEAYMYEDKLEDADADDDGALVFEEFLGSYARPKPILKNVLIMLVNTAIIYAILQASFLDSLIKVILVGIVVLKPQIISRPAALVFDAFKALFDKGKAEAELAKQNRGVWRPA